MELKYLLRLVSELPQNTKLNYVRGTDECKFIDVDIEGERINSETSTGEFKSWAPTYLRELAPKIFENEPFNLSGLLNNKGSFRPVLETIIAHTREFYAVRKGTATALVWIPSKPKSSLELAIIENSEIPSPKPRKGINALLPIDDLTVKVRDSFIKFWNIIDQKVSNKDYLVSNFEKALNPFIELLDFGYTSVFQIIDFEQYEAIISDLVTKHPKLSYVVNGRSENGVKYEVGSTHMYYRNYLRIIALSDFRANLDAQKRITLSVLSKTKASDFSLYLRAMRTKPFLLLAGISGTGKSRIVKQMAFDSCPKSASLRKDVTTPGNYCLIEVKPNWHDSTELIGYASHIGTSHYEVTPFLRFLAKAMLYEEHRVPFFVCLDEMNLAPVEQYFAEFLSVLESRKLVNGHITSEVLIPAEVFKTYGLELAVDLFGVEKKKNISFPGVSSPMTSITLTPQLAAVFDRLKNEGLRIPSNLIVIGTVNMDETTHQFSRKVIDRAMTIEMNLPEGQPFLDFFNNERDLDYTDTPLPHNLFLPSIVRAADAVKALANYDSGKTEWLKQEIARTLTALNEALQNTPFKVAYRVQNELLIYFFELWKENRDVKWRDILSQSVDQILMMKVLPRIGGDKELLETPLANLANFCVPYPKAMAKVEDMTERLERAYFTSFWP